APERAAVVDGHDHRASVRLVRHLDLAAERQRAVSRGERLMFQFLTACGSAAAFVGIDRGDSGFACGGWCDVGGREVVAHDRSSKYHDSTFPPALLSVRATAFSRSLCATACRCERGTRWAASTPLPDVARQTPSLLFGSGASVGPLRKFHRLR